MLIEIENICVFHDKSSGNIRLIQPQGALLQFKIHALKEIRTAIFSILITAINADIYRDFLIFAIIN